MGARRGLRRAVLLQPGQAIPWFAAFVALTVVSGLIDPFLRRPRPRCRRPVQVAFFVLNILGVSLTAYLLLQYSVRAREPRSPSRSGLLLNVLPRPIAERLKREPGVIADATTT